MRDVVAGLRLAVGTLSVVPVGQVDTSRRTAGFAMMLAPVAALPVGLAAGLTTWAAHRGHLPPMITGLLVVGIVALLTRCMHVDGLADTADGLGAGWERERALAVMKQGDVGPMGAVALIVVLGLQAAGVAALSDRPIVVAAALVGARSACTVLAAGPPPATPSGMGALMARTVPPLAAAAVVAANAALLTCAVVTDGMNGVSGVVALAVALILVGLVVRTCARVFGGITGDVFGASIEVSTACLLVVLSSGVR